jgi:hypothetical protein
MAGNNQIKKRFLDQLSLYINSAGESNPKVSKRGVDWHLNHTIKSMNSICIALMESNPENYRPRFSLVKSFILLTGYIPRGRGKSPKPFDNKENTPSDRLREMLVEAEKNYDAIDGLPANSHFFHPYFGHLNLKQAKKFIRIHSVHHLKIIRDIIGR